MKKRSIPLIMLLLMVGSGLLTALFQWMFAMHPIDWLLCLRDVFLLIFLHLLINHLCAPVVFLVFRKKFNYNGYWFRPRKMEKTLYSFLRVRRWKDKLCVYSTHQFSTTVHSAEEVICMTCHAEIVHECIAICSFLPLLLSTKGISLAFILVTSVFFAAIHVLFAIVQRYNRPRFIKIKNRRASN